jgi:small-conductance mechanosensitive channel
MMFPGKAIVFILATVLQSVTLPLSAQPLSENGDVAATPQAVESAAEAEQQIPFDPALVGLPGFPDPLTTAEDYARALELIEARLGALREVGPDAEAGDPPDDGSADAAAGREADQDPRTVRLQALLLAVKHGAAIAARDRELDDSLADQENQLATIEREGLGVSPPYPVSLLDQLRAEHSLKEYTDQMVDQRAAQAQRQADLAAAELTTAMRKRRMIRDRLAAATDADTRRELELALEVARLDTLVALKQEQIAIGQRNLVREEDALRAAQIALVKRKIELVQDDVVFSREALESRLTEVQSREDEVLETLETLASEGDTAEAALLQARSRLQEEDPPADRAILQEQVQAREDELAIVRKAVEYRGQLKALAATARTLLNRRYTVLQGAEQELWPAWLRETREFIDEIGKDTDFTLSELSALNSIELALSRRIAAPDLDEDVREVVRQRSAAIEVQNQLAERMLLIQDKVRSLAERLRLDLEPRVRERSLDQRLSRLQEKLAEWWNTEILVVDDHGIHARDVVKALGVFVLVFAIVWFMQLLLRRRLKLQLTAAVQQEESRTPRSVMLSLIRNTSQLFVLVVAFYAAMAVSGIGQGKLQEWLWTLLILAFYFQIGIWANAFVVDFFKRKRSRMERNDPSAVTGYGLLLFFIRVGIWMMVGISVLAHFRYPIAGLIGALGVGGIAVAFAVQNILSDVFNSMAIILDKPFRVGDFVLAGETLGVVEHIGVKTTRIRSLSGEQVVMSNTDLLASCIHNFKHMRERRVVFRIGVVYETPANVLERIPGIIAEVIRAQPHARFDRAHFFEYGDFALVFEVVYFVHGADYTRYMDTQQAVNLGIYRRFEEEGISFAYPTQELIVRRAAQAPNPFPGTAS